MKPGIFDGIWGGEKRAAISTPWQLQQEIDAGMATAAGVDINDGRAMRIAAVHACVKLLSETPAWLPWFLFRELERGKEKAKDDPRYRVFHERPNGDMNKFTFVQTMMVHLLLRGNFYALQLRGRTDNRVQALVPITPDRVTVEKNEADEIIYKIRPEEDRGAEVQTFTRREIFHVVGMTSNGWIGRSVIKDARETLGLAAAQESFGARAFSQRANHAGVLETDKSLSEKAYKRLKEQFGDAYSGLERAHKTALLEEGTKWKPTSMTMEDAQFLESRKFQVAEIARWFGVPLHMISELDRATNNNIEHQGLEFVTYGLMPWLVRIEMSVKEQLLEEDEDLFTEFNVDALLRGDTLTRARSFAIEFQNGFITQNEVREKQNRNPFDDPSADEPHIQQNLAQPGNIEQEGDRDATGGESSARRLAAVHQ